MADHSALYNQIGDNYNATRRADPFIAERLFHLLAPQTGKQYLDLGCGTGNYTAALAAKGTDICGIDPSEKMLKEAREKYPRLQWYPGSAEEIPFPPASFSGAVAVLTIHHWEDLLRSFRGINTVLKKGSRFVLFTSSAEQMEGYWLNHYFPQMLRDSIRQMPSLAATEDALHNAGFRIAAKELYDIRDEQTDLFLYAGKNRPELYFEPEVRKGISSFAALANAAEVKQGLERLREDISSGHFAEVRRQYENSGGDYLFIAAEK